LAHDILIIAGEASADLHGARLVRALKEKLPGVHFFGIGGQNLANEGVELVARADQLNVIGGADWWDKAGAILSIYKQVKDSIRRRRPTVAVLLDLPDFNLRLSRFLKAQGVPVAYYISPQVWAWRKYRVRQIRKRISKMLVVFPFEKAFYDQHKVPAVFVGHPLLEQVEPRQTYRTQDQLSVRPRIAILPGSRSSELRFHAPFLRETIVRLEARYPSAEIRIPVAPTLPISSLENAFKGTSVQLHQGDSREVMAWADIALVASGTATLETALVGTPFCLFFRASPSTEWVIRHIIRYKKSFGMPNLLSGKEVVREFLLNEATADALFSEATKLLEQVEYRKQMVADLKQCRRLLGETGASSRAAEEIAGLITKRVLGGTPVDSAMA
jgi:lipid-A-disaccharide synthase